MRIFVGIMLPEALWRAVGELQDSLGCGRAVEHENLHLTLLFAGENSEAQAQELHEALEAVRSPRFTLDLAAIEVLGAPERPEAVALGVRANPALEALHTKVAGAARRAGLELPRRRFRPHLTFARFGNRIDLQTQARIGRLLQARGDVVLPGFEVRGFAMVQSHLHQDGPVYEVLAEYPCA